MEKPAPASVSIFGIEHTVNAEIFEIDAFSGHGDYKEMIHYLSCQDPSKVKKTFIVHGDLEAQQYYQRQLRKEGWDNIVIPEPGEEFELK